MNRSQKGTKEQFRDGLGKLIATEGEFFEGTNKLKHIYFL